MNDLTSQQKRKTAFSVVLMTVALLVGLLIVWKAFSVFLLAFAGVLLALLLGGVSEWVRRRSRYPYRLVLLTLILALLLFFTALFWIATPFISNQLKQLSETLPTAFDQLKMKTESFINWKSLERKTRTGEFILHNQKVLQQAFEVFSFTVAAIVDFIFFLFVGIYLAFDPRRYVEGFLRIIPPPKKERAAYIIEQIGKGLKWWLGGKMISMMAIGILSMLGLWIIQVPLPFILGLLAGILAFIPYIGAILAAIPAILIGLSVSPAKAIYVVIVYLLVHAVEAYFITPIVEQRTVSLAPALTVVVQVILALLFGFLGLALASPITAVCLIFVDEVFVRKRARKAL